MDQNQEKKFEFKDKLTAFYNSNKIKIYSFIFCLLLIFFTIIVLEIYNNKKNAIISEKFIQAGVYLKYDKKDKAKDLYEEIIFSKNEFYSVLSLNTIIEQNLIKDKKKILEYFKILEKSVSDKDRSDLLIFKKALYLIKSSEIEMGRKLLERLIKKDSSFKLLAKEVIEN